MYSNDNSSSNTCPVENIEYKCTAIVNEIRSYCDASCLERAEPIYCFNRERDGIDTYGTESLGRTQDDADNIEPIYCYQCHHDGIDTHGTEPMGHTQDDADYFDSDDMLLNHVNLALFRMGKPKRTEPLGKVESFLVLTALSKFHLHRGEVTERSTFSAALHALKVLWTTRKKKL